MSKKEKTPPTTHILSHAEISKRILKDKIKKHKCRQSQETLLDHMNKCRDEQVAEYNAKKEAFLKAVRAYNRMNIETMSSEKTRLHNDYEEMLNAEHLNFLKETKVEPEDECEQYCCCPKCPPNRTGQLLTKRTLREMMFSEDPKSGVCLIEPWFRRYLILNKFIWAARTVIIHNRLLKVLEKLRTITFQDIRAIERSNEKDADEFHCHPVFLHFL